jgi:hypothetical protein
VFEDDLDLEETGMATEEISDMDTLLEEEVEDVGEVQLETAAAPAMRAAPAVRRTAVAVVEEKDEGMLVKVLAIATSAVLVLAIPVVVSLSKGSPSGLAKSIAGIFPGTGFSK